MIDPGEILQWERRSLNAWPAQTAVTFGNWELRLSGGYTKRANSANALGKGDALGEDLAPKTDFGEIVDRAERFYAANGQPTIFRLTPLADPQADDVLADAGYERLDPSLAMIASLGPSLEIGEIRIDRQTERAWLEGIAATLGIAPSHRLIHNYIVRTAPSPKAFATAYCAGSAEAFGLAVLERGAVGLFDIVVRPEYRGRGLGRDLTRALLAWGRSEGAEQAYLQVSAANLPALRLYESLGFRAAYAYHYRRRAA